MLQLNFFVHIYNNADEAEQHPVLLLSKQSCKSSNPMTNAKHTCICAHTLLQTAA